MSRTQQLDAYQYFIHKRTYARFIEDANRTETWEETIERVLEACQTQLKIDLNSDKEQKTKKLWRHLMTTRKALPAGRFLWSLGSRTVSDEGMLPLMNCAFVVVDSLLEPFRFTANMLMMGCGIGFSVESKYTTKARDEWIYERRNNDDDCPCMFEYDPSFKWIQSRKVYFIEDSREGWVKFLIASILRGTRRIPLVYSLEKIRPTGSPIKGFGGTSADPKLLGLAGKKLYNLFAVPTKDHISTSTWFDAMCIIAEVVVAGNVRRSALLSMGDPSDTQYLNLKNWSSKNSVLIPSYRQFANMSVNVRSFDELSADYWNTFNGDSEPFGFVKMNTCVIADKLREDNRSFQIDRYWPQGFNPCAEQPLHNKEVCCLSEIFLPNIESEIELEQALIMCYTICKHALNIGAPNELQTQKIVKTNQRMGISISGYSLVSDEKLNWAFKAKDSLYDHDLQYSTHHKWNPSIALTTIKPSGTISKLAGISGPGIHLPVSRYQIRRIRISKLSPLIQLVQSCGLPMEPALMIDGSIDLSGTQVISFYLDNGLLSSDHTAHWVSTTSEGLSWFFNKIIEAQSLWADNAVSVTVSYSKPLLDEMKSIIRLKWSYLKTFSGLLYSDHGFKQAPEEPITEIEYLEAILKLKMNNLFDNDNDVVILGDTEESSSLFDSEVCTLGTCGAK